MGFRRTEANQNVLQSVLSRVLQIDDVKCTFSSHGDQFIFLEETLFHGLCPEPDSPDLLGFHEPNTPSYFANPRTFMSHLHGLSTELRTLFISMGAVPEGGFEAIEDRGR